MDVRLLIEAILDERDQHAKEVGLVAEGCREMIRLINGTPPPKPEPRSQIPTTQQKKDAPAPTGDKEKSIWRAFIKHLREYTDDVLRVVEGSGEHGLLMEEISQAVLGRCDQDTNVALYLSVVQPLKIEGRVEVCNVRCYRLNPLYNLAGSV